MPYPCTCMVSNDSCACCKNSQLSRISVLALEWVQFCFFCEAYCVCVFPFGQNGSSYGGYSGSSSYGMSKQQHIICWMRKCEVVGWWHSLAFLNVSLQPHGKFYFGGVINLWGMQTIYDHSSNTALEITGSSSYGAPPTAYGTSSYGQTTYGGSSDYGGQALGSSDSKHTCHIMASSHAQFMCLGSPQKFVQYRTRLLVLCTDFLFCVGGRPSLHLCMHKHFNGVSKPLVAHQLSHVLDCVKYMHTPCKWLLLRVCGQKLFEYLCVVEIGKTDRWLRQKKWPLNSASCTYQYTRWNKGMIYDVYVLWYAWSNVQITPKIMRHMAQSMRSVSCLCVCVCVYVYVCVQDYATWST